MDAQLNDLIRLKQAPAAPVERWQRLPTRERLSRSTTMVPPCTNSPLRTRTPNLANMALKKTPEPSKFPVKYKHSPKVGLCKTPSKTPKRFHSSKTPVPSGKTPRARKSPPKSGKKKTPGRASPSGCRFIPNRYMYVRTDSIRSLFKNYSLHGSHLLHLLPLPPRSPGPQLT